jgi:hypothetical protein
VLAREASVAKLPPGCEPVIGNALVPGHWLAERLPRTRETARRLGLVTVGQVVAALVAAVERPARGVVVVEVPGIRAAA